MNSMNVAVLLTCHNRKPKTLECLDRLYQQKLSDNVQFAVFLVDDGCTDGTAEAVAKKFPKIRIIQGDGNLFWNRGMCLAWEESRKAGNYDGVIWLNDDTMLKENALQTVYEYSQKHFNSIIVGSISESDGSNKITYGGFKYRGKNKKNILEPKNGDIYCDIFNGNLVYVPASVYNQIGILDKFYHHSFGDFEYGRRANKSGFKCIITPIIGTCNRNLPMAKWNNGSMFARLKKLYSPLGNNPIETFHYFKEESILFALSLFLYLNIRAILAPIFPAIDDNRKNDNKYIL